MLTAASFPGNPKPSQEDKCVLMQLLSDPPTHTQKKRILLFFTTWWFSFKGIQLPGVQSIYSIKFLPTSVFFTFCPAVPHLQLHLLSRTHTHTHSHRLSSYSVCRGLWILLTIACVLGLGYFNSGEHSDHKCGIIRGSDRFWLRQHSVLTKQPSIVVDSPSLCLFMPPGWPILFLQQRPEQQPDLRDSSWCLPGAALPQLPVSILEVRPLRVGLHIYIGSHSWLCCDFLVCCMEIRSPTCRRGFLTASMPCNYCKQNTHIHAHSWSSTDIYRPEYQRQHILLPLTKRAITLK